MARDGDIGFNSVLLNHQPYTNAEKFSNDSYLASNLLSYGVGVDAQLGKHCDIFWLRYHTGIREIRYQEYGRFVTLAR